MSDFRYRIERLFTRLWQEKPWEVVGAEEVAHQGSGFGDLVTDTEIHADKIIGDFLRPLILEWHETPELTIEGCDPVHRKRADDERARYRVFVDPLDGSLNFKTRRGALGLPFTAAVTVTQEPPGGQALGFWDIIAAGVLDLRSGDQWVAERSRGCTLNNKPVRTANVAIIDLKNTIIIGENYYPDNRERLAALFRGERGWLRNPGSAAYEMALVASGTAAAYVCGSQKNHELGAGYLLVKEAGGVALDFHGHELRGHPYEFNAQTPIILAATQELGDALAKRLRDLEK